jgi:hypothetical protein
VVATVVVVVPAGVVTDVVVGPVVVLELVV